MRNKNRKKILMVLLSWIFLFGYGLVANRLFGYFCPSMALIGVPCPGCGLTRATLFLIQGRWADSFQMHPLLPVMAVWLIFYGYYHIKGKAKKGLHHSLIVVLVFSFLLFGYRMATSFGTEPLVWNRQSLAARLLANLATWKR